LKVSTYRRFLH